MLCRTCQGKAGTRLNNLNRREQDIGHHKMSMSNKYRVISTAHVFGLFTCPISIDLYDFNQLGRAIFENTHLLNKSGRLNKAIWREAMRYH